MINAFLNKLIFRLNNSTCKIGRNVIISRAAEVSDNCRLANNCQLSKTVKLGKSVEIGEYSKLRSITIGDYSVVESGVKVVGTDTGKIVLGKHCYLGINNVLDTSDDITIGNYVHIAGPSTGLWCHSSAKMALNSIPIKGKDRDNFRPIAPIFIDDNVYIGGNCTIYPGVSIGHHSIVAPNSAVTKSYPPYSLIGGVPAIRIKEIENKF